jgi:hypothetical protein
MNILGNLSVLRVDYQFVNVANKAIGCLYACTPVHRYFP